MRFLLAFALALASFGAAPSLAATATTGVVSEAVNGLQGNQVYVHPDAGSVLSATDADRIRERIGSQPDIFVAALPAAALAEAGGNADRLVTDLATAAGRRGTYAVFVPSAAGGTSFRAVSNVLPRGRAAALAQRAIEDGRTGGASGVALSFVGAVKSGSTGSSGSGNGSGGSSGTSPVTVLLIGGAVAGGGYLMVKKNREKKEMLQSLQGDRADLQAELHVLAEDVLRLEPEVAVTPEARPDYDAAVGRYRWAEAAIGAVDSPDDIPRIRRGIDEARYAMARTTAIVRGYEPPPPPPELQHRGALGEPAVELDEYRRPVYAGYGGGWEGGGFLGGNGMFTGLLIGQMLGGFGGGFGGFGGGFGSHGGGWGGGGNGGGGVGDVGGGDFGGGDVGGGDF